MLLYLGSRLTELKYYINQTKKFSEKRALIVV